MTNVECVIEDARWAQIEFADIAAQAVKATLEFRNLDPAVFEVSVMGCDDARIAALNGTFRDKDTPTNVLSWPSDERAADTDGHHPEPPEQDPMEPTELGDIAIAYETCASEAQDAGKEMRDHTMHLLVHATLHLLGYDHTRDADGDLMEHCETQILGKLGLADPYKQ